MICCKKSKVILLCGLILSFTGCFNDEIKHPIYVVAHVDSTNHVHWGKGYYKLEVFYSFDHRDSLVNGSFNHRLELAYTSKYASGDSVLLKVDKDNFSRFKALKIVHKNKKIKL